LATQATSGPLITVLVTTYKRSNILRRTLDCLSKQDLSPQDFEVVGCDDGTPDDTSAVVAEFAARVAFPVRYLRHENRGPGHAENRGLESAAAPLVLLLADDIFLASDCVRRHLEFHRARPEPTAAALGKTVQSPDLNQSAFLRKWNPFRFDELEEREVLPPYRFGAMHLSLKRHFLLQHGMFREERGRAGAACMEDLELGYRLEPHGLRLYYAKDALAYHYHLTTLDNAMARWYERGLNYGEFRRFARNPELTVYFHVLNSRTLREYVQVLRGPNSFRGAERYFTWHVVRHFVRMVSLNRFTARWFWRPTFDLAERHAWLESLLTAKSYRAFLYYQFLCGVRDGRRIYGD